MTIRAYFYKPEPEEFKEPSEKEFDEYYEMMSGLEPRKTITSYAAFVERRRMDHERKQALMMEERFANITSKEDIERIESQDGFIRWIHE